MSYVNFDVPGGPGCSSELAVLYENGPYSLHPNMSLTDNPYGWDATANIIFVDQPVNVGYSYSDVSVVLVGWHAAETALCFCSSWYSAIAGLDRLWLHPLLMGKT